ncbi:MAG: hypothetical protein WDN08_07370 [Rhizomicrobium sp.]
MALVEIDVIDPQPLQRGVDLLEDLRPRQPLVGRAHREEHLGRQDIRVAGPRRQRLAEKRLGGAAAIDVGGIDEIDPQLEGAIDTGDSLVALDADAIGQPGAERDFRNVQVTGAELAVFHGVPFRWICVSRLGPR